MLVDLLAWGQPGRLFLGGHAPAKEDSSAPKTMQWQAKHGASRTDPGTYRIFGLAVL